MPFSLAFLMSRLSFKLWPFETSIVEGKTNGSLAVCFLDNKYFVVVELGALKLEQRTWHW